MLRSDVGRDVLAAAGCPPAMFQPTDGTSAREGMRQFLHLGLQPLAALVQAELRDKLDAPELALSFDSLFAADLAGRARAFGSLVKGGMPVEAAAGLAGLLTED